MFGSLFSRIKRIGIGNNKEESSNKDEARKRLHLVLLQDRADVSADFLDMMTKEIVDVIKKYVDVDEDEIEVELTNKQNSDGTIGAPALYANIPIKSIKNSTRAMANKDKKSIEKETDEKKKKLSQSENKKPSLKKENISQEEAKKNVEKIKEEVETIQVENELLGNQTSENNELISSEASNPKNNKSISSETENLENIDNAMQTNAENANSESSNIESADIKEEGNNTNISSEKNTTYKKVSPQSKNKKTKISTKAKKWESA